MLQVSDYIASSEDGLPSITHEVALDAAGPALAAAVIADLLEGETGIDELTGRTLQGLCVHIRGRKGDRPPTQAERGLATALEKYGETGKVRGARRQRIIDDLAGISRARGEIELSGDPGEDWLAVRRLLETAEDEAVRLVAQDAKYLRLLNRGAVLRMSLGRLWREHGRYVGARDAVQDTLLQEHFANATNPWRGVQVMTVHKAKGKEFSEVIIYEGRYTGRIVRGELAEGEVGEAHYALRMAATRAMRHTTILTPAADPCPLL